MNIIALLRGLVKGNFAIPLDFFRLSEREVSLALILGTLYDFSIFQLSHYCRHLGGREFGTRRNELDKVGNGVEVVKLHARENFVLEDFILLLDFGQLLFAVLGHILASKKFQLVVDESDFIGSQIVLCLDAFEHLALGGLAGGGVRVGHGINSFQIFYC